jgi:signal peptidase complex subunit 2
MLLTTLQTLYAYFIEGDIIFVGKRKTFSKRVRFHSSLSTRPSAHKIPQIITERVTLSSRTIPSTPTKPPHYSLSLNYVRSTSGGKSLLARGKTRSSGEYNAWYDEAGVMDQEGFEQWVGQLVEGAMVGKVE